MLLEISVCDRVATSVLCYVGACVSQKCLNDMQTFQ